jgi:hypothetical protein
MKKSVLALILIFLGFYDLGIVIPWIISTALLPVIFIVIFLCIHVIIFYFIGYKVSKLFKKEK